MTGNFTTLAIQACTDKVDHIVRHFRPAKTRAYQFFGTLHTRVADIVEGPNRRLSERRRKERAKNPCGNVAEELSTTDRLCDDGEGGGAEHRGDVGAARLCGGDGGKIQWWETGPTHWGWRSRVRQPISWWRRRSHSQWRYWRRGPGEGISHDVVLPRCIPDIRGKF